jgi:lysyl-tRNA synthetase class 2
VVERSEQEQVRFEKLSKLRSIGNPFPNDVKLNSSTKEIAEAPPITDPGKVSVGTVPLSVTAGRIVALRFMGKAAFANIQDGHGRLQVYVRLDEIGAESFEKFKDIDIGDIIEVKGLPFITKTGEKSLWAKAARLLTKCLIPLPEKWHGLTDIEARYRHRYVDLIANPDVRETFKKRAQIIREIRSFLDTKGFIEVETPVLQSVPGGAEARPFNTHHNALGLDMHLRISLELPLKKLVVGGLERVYEIGRVFRNEGISTKHNPEFTMLEFYMAYATFEDLMNLTEELFASLVPKVCGSSKIVFNGKEIDFTPPYRRLTMQESIHVIGGVPKDIDLGDIKNIHKVAEKHKIHLPEKEDWGRCLMALWDHLVESNIVNPTFITHHPFSISPLARANDSDRKITDRFEIIVAGMEAGNAFSELNDAVDQRERFEGQARRKAEGDKEAHDVDEDFLRALEYGLPPTAGQGIGIDRLTMLLTNSISVRDVILFPTLKPQQEGHDQEKVEGADSK